MCVSGSARSSITVLSISVPSPSVFRRTSLFTAAAASRTIRPMRWNSDLTGCARIIITLSWMSRVSCRNSSRPVATGELGGTPASITDCDSIA